MSFSDPIADMLTRIRNANAAGHEIVEIPHSALKSEVARILKAEGFILDYTTEGQGGEKRIRLYLKYAPDTTPIIQGLKRVSSPGCRRYVAAKEVPKVLGGLGVAILSTSAGIVSDKDARKSKIGGEVMCYVW